MEVVTVRTENIRCLRALALACCVALVGAVSAQASPEALDTQLATAIQHAEFSMGADDHAAAQRHLGHVLNCIVGAEGEDFDAGWGHPCDGQGAGILNDAEAHPHHDDLAAVLNSLHGLAAEGVQAESLGAVRAAAAGVRALLGVVADFGG